MSMCYGFNRRQGQQVISLEYDFAAVAQFHTALNAICKRLQVLPFKDWVDEMALTCEFDEEGSDFFELMQSNYAQGERPYSLDSMTWVPAKEALTAVQAVVTFLTEQAAESGLNADAVARVQEELLVLQRELMTAVELGQLVNLEWLS